MSQDDVVGRLQETRREVTDRIKFQARLLPTIHIKPTSERPCRSLNLKDTFVYLALKSKFLLRFHNITSLKEQVVHELAAYSLDTPPLPPAAKWSIWHPLSGYTFIFFKHHQDPENLASHVYIPSRVATGGWITGD